MSNLLEAFQQWCTRPQDQRFESLAALRDKVNGRRMRSRSVDIDVSRIEASADDTGEGLVINGTITPCTPSHWSFGQLATTVKAPAGYLRSLPLDLVIRNLNHGIKNSTTRDAVKFMTVEASDEEIQASSPGSTRALNTLQAVTSPTYGRIWDADVCDAVSRVVDRTGNKFFNPKDWSGKPSGLYASDHDVFMFMIDGGSIVDAGPRAQLNRGFIAWNSETGARTMGLMTFLFNHVCGNHIIWGAQDVNKVIIRHTAGGPNRFDVEAAPALLAYANQESAPLVATIRKAQDYLLPAPVASETKVDSSSILEFCGRHGKFSRGEVNSAVQFAKSEEGDCRTLWQLVQGFTAYARGFDYIDARVDLEKRAGSLLNLVASGNN